ncbi:SUMF1/EgtB/PvdO family nonheme iron enzyme [Dongia rigui]|uniref:SUMF1/EgtB/PvdO family nonheme iron enzyme n=1 Tax=Dongia rigui TaxID=940149 RepID=A0ABU5DYZ3_9PROT|nr:SUMF1/EgtB/PvdO family nonheme iron enzyme [Dongia rigui]MDY0872552.1 SUMF1/EgtB/PvdO family nonheme iron enzyme [Dongia rigui]
MRSLLLLILWISLLAPSPAEASPRIALVIGNGGYDAGIGALPNPGRDAELMAKSLTEVGFVVTTLVDADQKAMKRAISDFGQSLVAAGPEATGLFYYAGHGVQIGGTNYLIPLAARIQNEADAEIEGVDAGWVLKQMEFANNRVNVVILDACRNNPLPRSLRSASNGLARMDAPKGSFIAYSTAPGDVAQDGSNGNSPYAAALAQAITAAPAPIEEMFRNVRVAVMQATGDAQIPWDSSSLTGAFYFRESAQPAPPAEAEAAAAAPPSQTAAPTTRSQTEAGPPQAGTIFRDCPDCPDMVVVPAGRFVMGAPKEDEDRRPDESPVHKVSIAAPFALMTTEVTRDQFTAFVDATGRDMSDGDCYLADDKEGRSDDSANWLQPGFAQQGNEPAVCVSWRDAIAYAEWLSNKAGATYRLPTEAEWEYATRAGRQGFLPWEENSAADACHIGNSFDASGHKQYPGLEASPCEDGAVHTAAVGSYQPNRFKLFDMAGNVWEWVQDCYRADYKDAPGDGSAVILDVCPDHVARGGSWIDGQWDFRFARRYAVDGWGRENIVGFRLARDL